MNLEKQLEELQKELESIKRCYNRAIEDDDEGGCNYYEREWEICAEQIKELKARIGR